MKEIENILFPVDLSYTSPKVAPYVQMVACKFEAIVHLLFVARNIEYFKGFQVPVPQLEILQTALIEGGKKELNKFRDNYFIDTGAYTKAEVRKGDISEEILAYVEPNRIDMIIMGTHGRKGIEKLFFGSVAEKVVKMSHIPVLLIKPHADQFKFNETPIDV